MPRLWLAVFTCSVAAMLVGGASAPAFSITVAVTGPALTAPGADDVQVRYVLVFIRHSVRSATGKPQELAAWARDPWPSWGVPPGQLTPHGKLLAAILGTYYRQAFAAQGLLSPAGCADAASVYFASDVVPRTIDTAQALATGMFPKCPPADHWLTGVKRSPVFHPTEADVGHPSQVMAVAAVRGRVGENLNALRGAYANQLDLMQHLTGVTLPTGDMSVDRNVHGDLVSVSQPFDRASSIAELLELEYANGFPQRQVGWGRVSLGQIQRLAALRALWFDLTERTHYLAVAKGSDLLSHLLDSLVQGASGNAVRGAFEPPGKRLTIVVGHDTNVANLASLLGVNWVLPTYQPDDPAPLGALVFEVGTRHNDGTALVRLYYLAPTLEQMRNATPLTLARPPAKVQLFVPGCSEAAPGFPCPLDRFEALVRSTIDANFVTP